MKSKYFIHPYKKDTNHPPPVIPAKAGISASTCVTYGGTENVVFRVDHACFPQQSHGVCIPTQSMGTRTSTTRHCEPVALVSNKHSDVAISLGPIDSTVATTPPHHTSLRGGSADTAISCSHWLSSMTLSFLLCILCILSMVFLIGCTQPKPEVVVYTALDEMYSRPILDQFETDTGIQVKAVYDTEAAKTTGLVRRLLGERSRPRADVFWNNELAQTILLKNEEILSPYKSPMRTGLDTAFQDEAGYWTGFAGRARVIIYNTDLIEDPSRSIQDLLDPRWKGKAAIANPLFGTTATHAAALFTLWGEERAAEFFTALKANDIAVLSGNGAVRDLVAQGEYAWGLTDTDDAHGGVEDGYPVKWHYLDQEGDGTLFLPNTVSLIVGAPHADEGQRLIDFLLSPEVEIALANARSHQIPLREGIEHPLANTKSFLRTLTLDWEAVAAAMEPTSKWLQQHFLE